MLYMLKDEKPIIPRELNWWFIPHEHYCKPKLFRDVSEVQTR